MGTANNTLVVIGAGGMGLAIARRLGPGRRVVIGDFSSKAIDHAHSVLTQDGYNVTAHQVDVADFESVKKLAHEAAAGGAYISTIVHAAGVSPALASPKRIYEVDLLGTANVIEAFLTVASPGTSMICIASMAGYLHAGPADLEVHLATAPREQLLTHHAISLDDNFDAAAGASAYLLSKRGNHVRVEAFANAWGRKGARLNSVSPGFISTPLGRAEIDGEQGSRIKELVAVSAMGRVGTPDDVVSAVAFLAGPESSFVTGSDLTVDGGATCGVRWGSAMENYKAKS